MRSAEVNRWTKLWRNKTTKCPLSAPFSQDYVRSTSHGLAGVCISCLFSVLFSFLTWKRQQVGFIRRKEVFAHKKLRRHTQNWKWCHAEIATSRAQGKTTRTNPRSGNRQASRSSCCHEEQFILLQALKVISTIDIFLPNLIKKIWSRKQSRNCGCQHCWGLLKNGNPLLIPLRSIQLLICHSKIPTTCLCSEFALSRPLRQNALLLHILFGWQVKLRHTESSKASRINQINFVLFLSNSIWGDQSGRRNIFFFGSSICSGNATERGAPGARGQSPCVFHHAYSNE